MTRTSRFVLGGVLLLLLLPVFVFGYYRAVRHYSPTDSFYCVILGWATDTNWAGDYSESKFEKISIGMTRDEVQKIMGQPVWSPNTDYWGYTWSPSSTHYHQRGFVFSPSGRVTRIVRGFYFD